MCLPPAIAVALTVASTAMQAYSAYSQGKQAQKVANYNAEVANRAAVDATQRGADAAAQVKERARRIAASQRAGAAAGGVVADTGSALDLLTETAGMGELDALTTINNAQREAYGYRTQATSARMQGESARAAGNQNAFGTILTGGAKLYELGQPKK